jgi:general secretion pathway protein G
MKTRLQNSSAGFTLVEIMVVVIVLAILAATIIPQFGSTAHDARVGRAKFDISEYENALERFFVHMDRYPSSAEGLGVLVAPPQEGASRWRGPYIKELLPDPWGNAYVYRSPGTHGARTYDIWSRGEDGADGGDGRAMDITNWQTGQPPAGPAQPGR